MSYGVEKYFKITVEKEMLIEYTYHSRVFIYGW